MRKIKVESVTRKTERTPEDLAKLKATRQRLQREKPTAAQLREANPDGLRMKHGEFVALLTLVGELKRLRNEAGLSLTDMLEKTGMDRASLSRLENGQQLNPTVGTLNRYAAAIGKRLVLALVDEE